MPSTPRWPRTDGQRLLHACGVMIATAGSMIGTSALLRGALGRSPARAIAVVVGLTVLVLALRLGGVTAQQLGLRAKDAPRQVVRGVVATAAVSVLLLGQLALFLGPGVVTDTLRTIASYGPSQRLGYLAVGIGAALLEEPIFRGYLQPLFVRRLGFVTGLGLTALVFAVLHGNVLAWPPVGLVGKLIVGLGLGLLRGRDRSLVAPMVCHALIWMVWGDA